MAYTDGVDIGKRAEELIHVELDLEHWHRLLKLRIMTAGTVDSFGNVFEYEIEIDFILLRIEGMKKKTFRI